MILKLLVERTREPATEVVWGGGPAGSQSSLSARIRSITRSPTTPDQRVSEMLNGRSAWGLTPLALAAQADRADAVAYLLDAGADPWLADHDGRNPVHLAARAGAVKALQVLLDGDRPISSRAMSTNHHNTKWVAGPGREPRYTAQLPSQILLPALGPPRWPSGDVGSVTSGHAAAPGAGTGARAGSFMGPGPGADALQPSTRRPSRLASAAGPAAGDADEAAGDEAADAGSGSVEGGRASPSIPDRPSVEGRPSHGCAGVPGAGSSLLTELLRRSCSGGLDAEGEPDGHASGYPAAAAVVSGGSRPSLSTELPRPPPHALPPLTAISSAAAAGPEAPSSRAPSPPPLPLPRSVSNGCVAQAPASPTAVNGLPVSGGTAAAAAPTQVVGDGAGGAAAGDVSPGLRVATERPLASALVASAQGITAAAAVMFTPTHAGVGGDASGAGAEEEAETRGSVVTLPGAAPGGGGDAPSAAVGATADGGDRPSRRATRDGDGCGTVAGAGSGAAPGHHGSQALTDGLPTLGDQAAERVDAATLTELPIRSASSLGIARVSAGARALLDSLRNTLRRAGAGAGQQPHGSQVQSCRHTICMDCARDLVRRHGLTPALCPYCRGVIAKFTARVADRGSARPC
ncbi:hypothetical protein GPECTOR_20g437 [Gonium pectorale]|uniref:Uncharacterized protein n=1 Tax=Gonium pectorale TaxID=33097 RepID=A0A150GIE1_GONPE|nr:hypothetical protein GPECTOR_20g437 [Gonium pectorale]|eukprot:KXZ49581.1 hypothetical protein GPECTOR_20g437 [Gonium pectorale]